MNAKKISLKHKKGTFDPSYLLAFFVEPKKVGDTFVDWPLHLTIIPWFYVHDIEAVDIELQKISQKFDKQFLQGKELTQFGERTVCLVNNEYTLGQIHRAVYALLQKHDSKFIDTQYFGSNYTPHITWQETRQFRPDDSVAISGFYLVKRHRDAAIERYIKTIAKEYTFNA